MTCSGKYVKGIYLFVYLFIYFIWGRDYGVKMSRLWTVGILPHYEYSVSHKCAALSVVQLQVASFFPPR